MKADAVLPRSWRQLIWRFITDRRGLALAALATVLVSVLAEIAFPYLLQQGVDAAIGEPGARSLDAVALAMLVVVLVIVLGHAAAILIEAWLFSGAAFELRRMLYAHFQNLPLAFLSRQRTGALTHRGTSDVSALETGVTELFSGLLFDTLVGIGVMMAMMLTAPRLSLLVVVVMVLATLLSERAARPMPTFQRMSQMLAARLAGRLQETLGATRTVRAFGAEAREVARLDTINRRILQAERQSGLRRAMVSPLWHFAEALGLIATLWYGGHLVAAGSISIGSLVGFMAYMELLATPMNRAGDYYAQFQACRGIAQRIVTLLGGVPAPPPSGTRRGVGASIALSHVAFHYPGSERGVLRDVSFEVAAGECVVLLGRNGAGKSTLFDLLLRFYPPESGSIVAGGVDLAEWDTTAWRATLGLMAQETMLFQGTLGENVAYGQSAADRMAVVRALEAAGAARLLARLPHGLDTPIGERGAGLSGGERQLIGLARLFLRDPRIVLLDEPTSALDGEALRTVLAALDRLARGRTVLLITHHPELLALADRVVLLDAGRVVASGKPEELAQTTPLYRSLAGEETVAAG